MNKLQTIGVLCAMLPAVCSAGPTPVISQALEYIGGSVSISKGGNGAGAAGLTGNPGAGTLAQTFSGSAWASASVDIDDFEYASSSAWVTWEHRFRVREAGITQFRVSFASGISGSVYSNYAASSNAFSRAENLQATISIAAFSQSAAFAALIDSDSCDSSWPNDCDLDSWDRSTTETQTLHYDPGYAVGAIIQLSGRNRASASADSYAGSAESSARSWVSYDVTAVPEPSSLSLAVLALGALLGGWRGRQRSVRALPPRSA